MTNKVIQIVPTLPPVISGLADYSYILAKQLFNDQGIKSEFIVADQKWNYSKGLSEFLVNKIHRRNTNSLLKLVQKDNNIILHYVGYGYAKKGCPYWLIEALEKWYYQNHSKKLITMFHEVYAKGRPFWTSAFWLSKMQKDIAKRLLKISDYSITNTQLHYEMLQNLYTNKKKSLFILPVFSNVREPEKISRLSERKKYLIIFGSAKRRMPIYTKYRDLLKIMCNSFNIDKIYDIGHKLDSDLIKIDEVDIVCTGEISSNEISSLLQKSIAGVINLTTDSLSKSGVYAAYSAHSMLPLVIDSSNINTSDMEYDKPYLTVNKNIQNTSDEVLQKIANNAFEWYRGHRIKFQASKYAELLKS